MSLEKQERFPILSSVIAVVATYLGWWAGKVVVVVAMGEMNIEDGEGGGGLKKTGADVGVTK